MKEMVNYTPRPQITLTEAKKVLGTTAKGLSDNAIRRLVAQVDVLTDIIVAQASDSKINTSIDISKAKVHTNE